MIVLDANLVLYAYDATAQAHRAARSWLEETFSGAMSVGVPWVEHGGVLHTTDRGFARYPSLRWRNPLA